MQDVRVALHIHQFRHAYRAVLRTRPRSLRPRFHQHDVFGSLFRIGGELRLVSLIFSFIAPRGSVAGNRMVERFLPLHLHEHFGRAARHGDIGKLQVTVHVGRRIHHREPDKFEWIGAHGRFEALG